METYTTFEQAKKLLELGVHPDTSNMRYALTHKPKVDVEGNVDLDSLEIDLDSPIVQFREGEFYWGEQEWVDPEEAEWYENQFGHPIPDRITYYMPCWSVGQLIDIYVTCQSENGFYTNKEPNYVDWIIELIEQSIAANEWDINKYCA